MVTRDKVRTAQRAIARLEDLAARAAGVRPVEVTVTHLDNPDQAAALSERLSGRLGERLVGPIRVGDHRAGVGDDRRGVADDAARALDVEVGDDGDVDVAPGAAPDLGVVAPQHREGAAADGADAEQSDADGGHAV